MKRFTLKRLAITWHYILPPGVLAALTTLWYYSSLTYPFVFDDLPNILHNYEIRQFCPAKLFFSSTRWISKLINQLTHKFFMFSPFAYRTINLCMHICAGILVFYLTLLLLKKRSYLIATLTSGLFLLHPVQTQTVSYVTQIRIEGLATIFALLIITIFVKASTARIYKYPLYGLCLVLTAFAAGTKEIIVVLPMLLMLVDWFFVAQANHTTFLRRLPFHLLLMGVLYYTYLKMGSPVNPSAAFGLKLARPNNRGNILTATPSEMITPLKYLTSQFRVVLHYITMFFWPWGITFDYGWKIPSSFWSPTCIYPLIALVSLATTGLVSFIKNRTSILTFCMAWFFIVVTPRSSIIPSTELVCDYKTYMASFGILLYIAYLLAKLITYLYNRYPSIALQPALLLLLSTGLGLATHTRNKVWSNRLRFWEDVMAKTHPHTPARAYNNYAVGLVYAQNIPKALEYYHKAIETDPTYAEPVINLALHYQAQKNYRKALTYYKKALTLKETHYQMYNNLGLLFFDLKNEPQAEKNYKAALKIRPFYSKAHFNLGRLYQKQQKYEQALRCYKKAIKGDLQSLTFYYAYAALCYKMKQYEQAIPALEHIETKHTNLKDTRPMLATCYYSTQQYEKAITLFSYLHTKHPKNISYPYNLAQSCMRVRKYDQALPLLMKCRAAKHLPHVHLHLAKCLHYTGQTQEAKKLIAIFTRHVTKEPLKTMWQELSKELSSMRSA